MTQNSRRLARYAKPILLVMVVVILFACWEHYLFYHFLGTFDHQGMAMQKSENGYAFFYRAWPLWSFPLFIGVIITAFWKGRTFYQVHQRLTRLQEEHVRQQAALHEVETALRSCQREMKLLDNRPLEENTLPKLQQRPQSFDELKENYLASLNFIEKLLMKIKE